MGWDKMGWDGMGWDGMGWDGMGWDGMSVTRFLFSWKDQTIEFLKGKEREGKGREG